MDEIKKRVEAKRPGCGKKVERWTVMQRTRLLIEQGFTDSEIAERMGVTRDCIRQRRKKIKVRNR